MTIDISARSHAESHFRSTRDAKTASVSKRISEERIRADSDKSARLKAARLERDKEQAGEEN